MTSLSAHPAASDLAESMLWIQNADALRIFIRDLCPPSQLKELEKRWAIAKLIHMGFSYRVIGKKTGASSSTIAHVARAARANSVLREVLTRRQRAILSTQ